MNRHAVRDYARRWCSSCWWWAERYIGRPIASSFAGASWCSPSHSLDQNYDRGALVARVTHIAGRMCCPFLPEIAPQTDREITAESVTRGTSVAKRGGRPEMSSCVGSEPGDELCAKKYTRESPSVGDNGLARCGIAPYCLTAKCYRE